MTADYQESVGISCASAEAKLHPRLVNDQYPSTQGSSEGWSHMGEPVRRADDGADVVSMPAYISDTIGSIDALMSELTARREDLAARLAAINAAESMAVLDAAADYHQRVTDDRPYEGAEDSEALLAEAFSRHVR